MGGWDCEGGVGLEGEGRFDHGGDEAGGDVPFDVAVEEPDAWRGGRGVSLGVGSGFWGWTGGGTYLDYRLGSVIRYCRLGGR